MRAELLQGWVGPPRIQAGQADSRGGVADTQRGTVVVRRPQWWLPQLGVEDVMEFHLK